MLQEEQRVFTIGPIQYILCVLVNCDIIKNNLSTSDKNMHVSSYEQ